MTNYTRKPAEDGGARGPITRINHIPMTIVYQPNALELASRQREFKDLVASIARYLRAWAVTKREQSVCDETARGRSLSIDGLEILCELAARSERPFALEELIRGQVIKSLAAPSRCPVDTFLDETRAQAKGDVAQAGFIAERTATRRDAALDALGLHLSKLRVAIDALMVWPRSRGIA